MPFQIIRDDITRVRCDAIVNAANSTLLGGAGVDGAIHAAAGPKLRRACARLGGCPTGKAKITRGYDLPCKYVIHTVGPIWQGGGSGEEAYLRSCYRESLALAVEYGCESVAFPLISAGSFGYPKEEALQIAVDEISHFLMEHELYVTLVVYSRSSFRVSRRLIEDVIEYIDDVYVQAHYVGGETTMFSRPEPAFGGDHLPAPPPTAKPSANPAAEPETDDAACSTLDTDAAAPGPTPWEAKAPLLSAPEHRPKAEKKADLPLAFSMPQQRRRERAETAAPGAGLDESFTEMLLRKIDEKGMTDAECYKRANIDRKLFSKIRKNAHYQPSKTTAIAFAIALELPLEETQELLMKAGFALSHSIRFDVIIEYFIRNHNYNIFEINEVLFEFDQSLLGAS